MHEDDEDFIDDDGAISDEEIETEGTEDEPFDLSYFYDEIQLLGRQMRHEDNDAFFTKMFINWFPSFDFTYSDDQILKQARNRLSDRVGHRRWIAEYDAILKAHAEAHPEDHKYVSAYKFLKPEDIALLNGMMKEDNAEMIAADFPITENTKVLAGLLELTKSETLIFDLAMRLSNPSRDTTLNDWMMVFMEFRYKTNNKSFEDVYSVTLGIDKDEFVDMKKSFLFMSGMLVTSDNMKPFQAFHHDLLHAFCEPGLTAEILSEKLFPSSLKTELTPESYPHLQKEIGRIEHIIGKSLEKNSPGINIMMWGLPGTGKTELALALAAKNNWKLIAVGDISNADNKEKSRAERLTSLKIALKLYGSSENTIVLFDEMEDLFKTDNNATFSKAFINRLIETTPVPIIWTTNELRVLGNAVLRRMVYNIGFEVPSTAALKTIWKHYADKNGVKLEENVIHDLAVNFKIVPALINNAIKITSMANLPPEEIPEVVESLDRLMNYGQKRPMQVTARKDVPYDASCANADIDLMKLSERLKKARPNFSACMFGPPGTGKSEYARFVARELGKQVLYKRASDLISMWVGETEANIAKAFKEAKEEEMVLIIDEGDTFLRNREKARNSWEVSQVNEMLSQMEVHDQPFFLTTNLMDDLDPASLRRFTFKIKFDFMQPDQSARLFKQYFGVEAPATILKNEILTPGDFANVKRKADILNITDAAELYDLVAQECDLKPQKKGNRIGF